jgi:hypothetical protein
MSYRTVAFSANLRMRSPLTDRAHKNFPLPPYRLYLFLMCGETRVLRRQFPKQARDRLHVDDPDGMRSCDRRNRRAP